MQKSPSALEKLWDFEDRFTALAGSPTGTIRFDRKEPGVRRTSKTLTRVVDTVRPNTKATRKHIEAWEWLDRVPAKQTVSGVKDLTRIAKYSWDVVQRGGMIRTAKIARKRLKEEFQRNRKGTLFGRLYRSVVSPVSDSYAQLSKSLKVSPHAARGLLRQARQRYYALLLEEAAKNKNVLTERALITGAKADEIKEILLAPDKKGVRRKLKVLRYKNGTIFALGTVKEDAR
jgi:hypothetical protein